MVDLRRQYERMSQHFLRRSVYSFHPLKTCLIFVVKKLPQFLLAKVKQRFSYTLVYFYKSASTSRILRLLRSSTRRWLFSAYCTLECWMLKLVFSIEISSITISMLSRLMWFFQREKAYRSEFLTSYFFNVTKVFSRPSKFTWLCFQILKARCILQLRRRTAHFLRVFWQPCS